MFDENDKIKVFRVTLKEIVKRLSTIKDCNVDNLKDKVIEKFDGYNYEGEEELKGFDTWEDISNDGDYTLLVQIDHEDAYEFTLYVKVTNAKATVYNVL